MASAHSGEVGSGYLAEAVVGQALWGSQLCPGAEGCQGPMCCLNCGLACRAKGGGENGFVL